MTPLAFRHCLTFLLLLVAAAASAPAASFEKIPDTRVLDQHGHPRHFSSDLLAGNIVAVNFIFTACTAICPQIGASSAALARTLAAHPEKPYRVISVSIDPDNDTPERLLAWSEHFGPAPAWTLVTGGKPALDGLLRALKAYTADKNLHSSNFLIGNPATGEWRQVDGAIAPEKLFAAMQSLETPSAAATSGAGHYFPDVTLLNQDGEPRRFFTDLVQGRVVVINTIFADCGAVCPIMAERFARVQAALGDRVGRDVFLISITVDPVNDTPEKLHGYAQRVGAGPGWQFLTGEKAGVDLVLKKLGQYVDHRDAHSNLIIVGNETTGLWKKAFGLAPPEEVVRVVESVANDGR